MEQILEATSHEMIVVRPFIPIFKTIQIRLTSHVGHCWRSKDKLMSDVLQWTPSHGHASVGQPTSTYLQQVCTNTGCSVEDLLGAIDYRDKYQERANEIYTSSMT